MVAAGDNKRSESVDWRACAGRLCLVVAGEIDLTTMPVVADAFAGVSAGRPAAVDPDLAGLRSIDVRGVDAIAAASARMSGWGGLLATCAVSATCCSRQAGRPRPPISQPAGRRDHPTSSWSSRDRFTDAAARRRTADSHTTFPARTPPRSTRRVHQITSGTRFSRPCVALKGIVDEPS